MVFILIGFAAELLFFLNEPAAPVICTLSLHDALPISGCASGTARASAARRRQIARAATALGSPAASHRVSGTDRKRTRLNSSHLGISYAVFCVKKKRKQRPQAT